MSDKKSLIIYTEWKPLIDSLPPDKRLLLYDLIFAYDGLDYEPTVDDPHIKGIVDFVLPKIKENDRKFQTKSNQARDAANKKWAAYKLSQQRR